MSDIVEIFRSKKMRRKGRRKEKKKLRRGRKRSGEKRKKERKVVWLFNLGLREQISLYILLNC